MDFIAVVYVSLSIKMRACSERFLLLDAVLIAVKGYEMESDYSKVRRLLSKAQNYLENEDDVSERINKVIELLIEASINAEKSQQKKPSNVLHIDSILRRRDRKQPM